MNKPAFLACLAALVFCARADAIPFLDIQFEATAIAIASDGPPGLETQSGPLGDDAVSVSAASLGTTDVATAGAIVGLGLLSASVDVSASDISSAVATSRFSGSFVNAGPVSLSIDFTGLDFTSGSGGASTTLFVSLASDGVTLFADYILGAWQFAYAPVLGTTSLLDLTLSSEASAAFLSAGSGNASGFGMVTMAGTVPEASTWLLLSLGLGAVAVVVRRGTTPPRVNCA